jgi:hypothetical protein
MRSDARDGFTAVGRPTGPRKVPRSRVQCMLIPAGHRQASRRRQCTACARLALCNLFSISALSRSCGMGSAQHAIENLHLSPFCLRTVIYARCAASKKLTCSRNKRTRNQGSLCRCAAIMLKADATDRRGDSCRWSRLARLFDGLAPSPAALPIVGQWKIARCRMGLYTCGPFSGAGH